MNILQVLPELNSGGVERGTVDLAKYLLRHGHKSVVVSAGGSLVSDLAAAGVTHYTLPVHKKSPLAVWRSVRALAKIVQMENIDLIHARSRVPALVAFFTSHLTQKPFITTCHGFYSRHALSRPMGWGKLVIVASHVIGRRMRDDFGVPQERLRLIPRGVDLNEFRWTGSSKEKAPVVGVIGRLTPIKGHPLFLKAMARVARVYPDVKIRVIGDAPKPQHKEELLSLAKQLGLSKSVEFLGTRYDIPKQLSEMSVLVVPSVGEEAFGRVVIEAGACGVPVIATRIGGLAEIVDDGRDGLLVPPDDPRGMADAALKLLKEPELGEKLAVAMREKVEKEFPLELMFERTVKVYEEALAKKRFLVIKLSAVGDVILSIPSIRAIRQAHPDAWISVLVGDKSRDIVRHCPYADDVIVHDETAGRRRSILKTARLLRRENYDIVVDLQNNRVSHLLAWLSGARIRAGYRNAKGSFLLNRRVKDAQAPIPPIEHQYRVLSLVGIEPVEKRLELWAGPSDEEAVKTLLDQYWISSKQTIVGINPGSSLRWPTKQWPLENFAKLCDELAKRNVRVVITGTSEDAEQAEELLKLTRNKPVNAVGRTTLPQLVALAKRCSVFVSSDSAPMHVAASVDVPLVAIFGPTDPKRHLVAPSAYEVMWKEVHCSPCYLRSCPMGHICMKRLSVQEVLDAVLRLLDTRKGPVVQKQPAFAGF